MDYNIPKQLNSESDLKNYENFIEGYDMLKINTNKNFMVNTPPKASLMLYHLLFY